MDKFCTNCGKPLPEDGVCDCMTSREETEASEVPEETPLEPAASETTVTEEPAAVEAAAEEPVGEDSSTVEEAAAGEPAAEEAAAAEQPDVEPLFQKEMPQEPPMFQAAPAEESAFVKKTKETLGGLGAFCKDYWHDPMKATVTVLKAREMRMSVIMMVINVLLSGLVLFAAGSRFLNAVVKATMGLFGGSADVEMPFFLSMFMGMATAVVALALSMAAVFALLKLARINARFSYVVMAVGINTVFCSAALVLALLFILFGWVGGVVLALFACAVFWCVLLTLLLVRVFGVPMDGLRLVVTGLLLTVVVALTVWAGSNLASEAASEMSVAGYSFGDNLDDMEDLFGGMADFF